MISKPLHSDHGATRRILFHLVFVWLPLSVGAETIIAQYDFPDMGKYDSPNLISSDTDQDSTAGAMVLNFPAYAAGTTKTAGGTAHVKSTAVAGTPEEPGDEAEAIESGHYVSFTVEPKTGRPIKLASLSFDILLDADPQSDPPPKATWVVKTSIGGFGAEDPTVGAAKAPVSQEDDELEPVKPRIDLSGLPPVTAPVEFRIYIYDNQHSSGVIHRLDNVILKAGK